MPVWLRGVNESLHCSATRELLAMDLVILNYGQVSRTKSELTLPLPTTTPMGGSLPYLMDNVMVDHLYLMIEISDASVKWSVIPDKQFVSNTCNNQCETYKRRVREDSVVKFGINGIWQQKTDWSSFINNPLLDCNAHEHNG
ncbi:hypothetical protein TNCV_4875181 [Trichonephila clavipes]|nr:hypothetical protein TNCV_4875181 [Trichonephila clavipes]